MIRIPSSLVNLRNSISGISKTPVTAASSMRFVRVSSSMNQPETIPSKAGPYYNFEKNIKALSNNDLSTSGVISALKKKCEESAGFIESDSPAPAKVSDILTRFNELIESTLTQEKLVFHPFFRTRSSSLPFINLKKIERESPQEIYKIEFPGRAFSPDNLMYSDSLQKSADKYGVVIGVRLPSEVGQIHLQEGHPTKNFHVKAKSSTAGPTAGFIAENPKYSKVGPKQWEKQEKYINEALEKGAKLLPLTLSSRQIDNAIKHAGLRLISESTNEYTANYHGEEVRFIINPQDHIVKELNGSVVRVLTNPPETDGTPSMNKAITADYDLFSIVTKSNQSINQRPLEVRHNARLINKEKSLKPSALMSDYFNAGGVKGFNNAIKSLTQPKSVHGEEDPDKGNVHFYGETIINDINKNVEKEGFTGGKLVWHNDETGNPFSQGFVLADKPVFYIPGQKPKQITTMKELSAFYNELKRQGYAPESSAKLGI